MSKVLTNKDFQKFSIYNVRVHPVTQSELVELSALLAQGHKGLVVTNTDTSEIHVWNGSEFVSQKTQIPDVPVVPSLPSDLQTSAPLSIATGASWKVQNNSQVLFTEEIQLDGELDLEGSLSEVS